MEVDMYIAIARFPAVPPEQDKDFRDWFASSNDQLRETAGLKGRHLLRAPDGSYIALMEHESASTFAAMHMAEAVSMIHSGLGRILNDCQPATRYEVVVDCSISEPGCGGGHGSDSHEGSAQSHVSGRCCHDLAMAQ
jgi:heme-degrading monooxygenase HmoA